MAPEKRKSIVYVENGQVTDELFCTAQVEHENDRLRLTRGRPMAFAKKEIGRGGFYITAELCLIDKAIGTRGEKARYLYIADPAFLFSGESSWKDGEIDLISSPDPSPPYPLHWGELRHISSRARSNSGRFRALLAHRQYRHWQRRAATNHYNRLPLW